MKDLTVQHKDFGLSEQEATEITKGLSNIIKEREVLEEQYVSIVMEEITPELSAQAKELRLRIRDNRTKGLNKWHKANKDYFLQGGKFVDSIKNKNIIQNEQMEEKLLAIEKYEENLEKERKAKISNERKEKLGVYASEEDLAGVDLSEMNDKMFNAFYTQCKESYEEEQEIKKAEEEKLKRLQEENEKLQKEKREREAKEAKEAKAKKEKEDAERRAKEELEKGPKRDRLLHWLEDFTCPQTKTEDKVQDDILERFSSFKNWAEKQINNI